VLSQWCYIGVTVLLKCFYSVVTVGVASDVERQDVVGLLGMERLRHWFIIFCFSCFLLPFFF
jgi:hypothetical protein